MKVVYGDNFIAVEEADHLTDVELFKVLDQLESEEVRNISLMLSPHRSRSVVNKLSDRNYYYTDTTIYFYHSLEKLRVREKHNIEWVRLEERDFKMVWVQAMQGSLNHTGPINIDEQMGSVKKELGRTYRDSCLVVNVNGQIAGACMPHIEPGTTEEGRLFYFGLLPEFRGRGLAGEIHLAALKKLLEDFSASYYIGATSMHNIPMLKVFERNGCREIRKKEVYKKKRW
ncbi:GNAT family N-acetyltransferase [Halobacillus massiliensis]|uniref:GNAT family N-acetyltransferase n=1 Tax=Halobacillus massiliensis TaxID=1926286 RepID=UPI0009E44062|nr:GNAT family N-acetyltransferase [Halobacillus massiliensis]